MVYANVLGSTYFMEAEVVKVSKLLTFLGWDLSIGFEVELISYKDDPVNFIFELFSPGDTFIEWFSIGDVIDEAGSVDIVIVITNVLKIIRFIRDIPNMKCINLIWIIYHSTMDEFISLYGTYFVVFF